MDLSVTSGAKHCHCPTSNLFLGSGLLNTKPYIEMEVDVGMGSDVGASISYEILCTMGDMYTVTMTPDSEADSIPPDTKGEFKDYYLGWLDPPFTATLDEMANRYEDPGVVQYPGFSILGTCNN